MSIENLKIKSNDELIDLINHGTTLGDKIKAILDGRMLDKLVTSLNTNAESSNALSKRIFWLNFIIMVATIIYTISIVIENYCN
jgi:hypothetical protein